MSEDVKTGLMGLTVIVTVVWNLWQYNRLKSQDSKKDIQDLRDELELVGKDVEGLKTKVGLFWHLVEEHMSSMLAKANPIHLELDEKAAANVYNVYKSKSPTHTLKVLAKAIDRELAASYMAPDEVVAFTCILGAIKSQLYDRNEWRPQDDLT